MVSSAPSARADISLVALDAAAITRAPNSFAIWRASTPTPEPAPSTSTVSPGATRALSTSMCHTEMNVMGTAASDASSTFAGAGTRIATGTTTFSAMPPCVCSPSMRNDAHRLSRPPRHSRQRPQVRPGFSTTRSPSFTPATPAPRPLITPHTSPWPGVGSGTSASSITSGPPCCLNRAARSGSSWLRAALLAAGGGGRGGRFAAGGLDHLRHHGQEAVDGGVGQLAHVRDLHVPIGQGRLALVDDEAAVAHPLVQRVHRQKVRQAQRRYGLRLAPRVGERREAQIGAHAADAQVPLAIDVAPRGSAPLLAQLVQRRLPRKDRRHRRREGRLPDVALHAAVALHVQ